MPELNEKEANIARVQTITNLAHAWQDKAIETIPNLDIGMIVDAAAMLIVGASKQCPTPEVRLSVLSVLNDTIQRCAAMNHQVMPPPPAPEPGAIKLLN